MQPSLLKMLNPKITCYVIQLMLWHFIVHLGEIFISSYNLRQWWLLIIM